MKNFKYILMSALSILMASCTLDKEITRLGSPEDFVAPVLDQMSDVLSDANTSGVEQVTFTWSEADFGADVSILYSVYAVKGEKKALLGQSFTTSCSIAKGDLVGQVYNNLDDIPKNELVDIDTYVEAAVSGSAMTEVLASNTISYRVFTYLPAKKNIWLPGAYQEWNQLGTEVWEYAAGTSEYRILVNVSDGSEGPYYFKVVNESQDWVGMNDGYVPDEWEVADPKQSDGNFSVTKDEPILYLTINTKTKKVKKETVTAVTLTGDFNGWDTGDTEPNFTYNAADNVWESPVIAFTAGQGWKFRLNKTAWYGDAGPSSEIEGGIATTAQASDNIATPGTGNYIVKVHGNRTPFVIEYVQQ